MIKQLFSIVESFYFDFLKEDEKPERMRQGNVAGLTSENSEAQCTTISGVKHGLLLPPTVKKQLLQFRWKKKKRYACTLYIFISLSHKTELSPPQVSPFSMPWAWYRENTFPATPGNPVWMCGLFGPRFKTRWQNLHSNVAEPAQ